jgi:DNA-binding LacI/PurR family transcriptional regulator
MTNHGLIPQTLPSGLSEESGARAADTLLQRTPGSRPTAVAAFNDHCALGVLHRLRGSSLHIPDDLSLTGFDDIPAAGYRHIDLTTIRQDADHIGHHAIQRLRDRLDDHQSPALPYLVPPSLIIRRTTAPPT